MQEYSIKIIVILFSLLMITSCKKTSIIELSGKKDKYAIDVGYGVSMMMPLSYKKAKSYVGYQVPLKMGSISIELEQDFDAIKHYYTGTSISARDGSIYREQPVIYNGHPNAFYVEYYDNPQKRYRLILIIKQSDRTYVIKGFHRGQPEHSLTDEMRKAILTTSLGIFENQEKEFSKVVQNGLFHSIYTRDNKYPTDESDEVIVKVITLQKDEIHKSDHIKYLENRIKSITNSDVVNSNEKLTNGMLYRCLSTNNNQRVMGILLTSDKGDSIIVECVGNEKADIVAVSNLMLSQMTSVM